MFMPFNESTFGFRFLSLSDQEFLRLQELLPRVAFTARHRGNRAVVSCDVDEKLDLDSLCAFLSESKIDPNTYSVWVSLIASGDQGGVALPARVLALIRRTSGGVDFSFASCLGNCQEE